jgi:hypothetical protein
VREVGPCHLWQGTVKSYSYRNGSKSFATAQSLLLHQKTEDANGQHKVTLHVSNQRESIKFGLIETWSRGIALVLEIMVGTVRCAVTARKARGTTSSSSSDGPAACEGGPDDWPQIRFAVAAPLAISCYLAVSGLIRGVVTQGGPRTPKAFGAGLPWAIIDRPTFEDNSSFSIPDGRIKVSLVAG